MPVDQALLDFHPLEERTDEAGNRVLRVLLVAAAREMVDGTLQAVTLAGLTPTMSTSPASRCCAPTPTRDSGIGAVQAEALVDVGSSVTNIVIHQGGVPRFVRILLMGGGDVTAAGRGAARRADGAGRGAQAEGPGCRRRRDDTTPAQRAIEATGGAFVEEVRGSLDYFMAQPGAAPVTRIVLSGGGSRLAGLAERLAAATRKPVDVAAPLSRIALGRTGLTPEQLAYSEQMISVPVGLALGAAS